jgi:NAD(P)-dependent dehydrogenase (short-subunit alcohol dehydrogenase family)
MSQHLVLVGGSRGLGKVFAEMAAERGHAVSVLSRSRSAELRAIHYTCDITQPQEAAGALQAAVRDQGAIQGMVFFQRYRGTDDGWEGEIQTSLTAVRRIIEQSVPRFAAEGPRAIVLVSSVNAAFVSPHLPCGYHVAKAGLCQMARYYACQLGSRGIRVNAVCPSTFLKAENRDFYEEHPELARRLAATSPLNRMGTSTDVAKVVLFLLGDDSSFVTGQALLVDGGISLRWPEHREIGIAPAVEVQDRSF